MSHLKENNLKPKITVLAITLNEEENVKKYVQSFSFADEIIFVDGYSTDATTALAKELGVTVIQRTFDDFATQRNFALQQSNNDWVLFFDLDENITPELAEEIQMTISSGNNFSAYYVKSNFHFIGKHMKFGGCNPKKSIRIFKKQSCHYNESLVYEKLIIQGKTAVLKNHSNHYAYKNFDSYNEKLNLFSTLKAQELYQKKIRPNIYHFFLRPIVFFIKNYIVKLGFLDGKEGFILAYLHSFAVLKRYLLLWLMYRKID